jgi:auxin-responsive protein IAA
MATGLGYESTELRLGLPGGVDGEGRSASGKRGFAETIDLKLKLEPAAAAVEREEEAAGDNRGRPSRRRRRRRSRPPRR